MSTITGRISGHLLGLWGACWGWFEISVGQSNRAARRTFGPCRQGFSSSLPSASLFREQYMRQTSAAVVQWARTHVNVH